jgi:hypothetical protein
MAPLLFVVMFPPPLLSVSMFPLLRILMFPPLIVTLPEASMEMYFKSVVSCGSCTEAGPAATAARSTTALHECAAQRSNGDNGDDGLHWRVHGSNSLQRGAKRIATFKQGARATLGRGQSDEISAWRMRAKSPDEPPERIRNRALAGPGFEIEGDDDTE